MLSPSLPQREREWKVSGHGEREGERERAELAERESELRERAERGG
jgi:hypothetical protein